MRGTLIMSITSERWCGGGGGLSLVPLQSKHGDIAMHQNKSRQFESYTLRMSH